LANPFPSVSGGPPVAEILTVAKIGLEPVDLIHGVPAAMPRLELRS
jgi:hypothetical protein